MNAALKCGLSLSDFKELEIGAIIDIVIARQNDYASDEESRTGESTTRQATQADWDKFSR